MTDLAGHAADLLQRNNYLVVGTTDAAGHPWTSPVYFAADGLRAFIWVSQAGADHSRHLAERPRVSLLVYDSSVPPYHGRAVYGAGTAAEIPEAELDHALAVYPGSRSAGATTLERSDVTGESPYRLYRAVATDLWVLCPREPRQPCPLHGRNEDHRARVEI